MSSVEQPAPSHSTKPERRRAPAPSSRLHKTGPPQSRMVRFTFNLTGDLVDRVRNAVYWSPSLKLSWLIAQSLRTSLAEMESSRQGPFPQRKNPLRAGRPRMVGQTMQLFPRARLTRNGAARSDEGVSQAPLFPYLLSDGVLRIVSPSLERTPSLSSHHFSVDSPAKSLCEIHQF
jgi:hypothetical protein